MQLKRTNAMQIPLLLVRMAHKIALVTLISGDGFNCEGASDIALKKLWINFPYKS